MKRVRVVVLLMLAAFPLLAATPSRSSSAQKSASPATASKPNAPAVFTAPGSIPHTIAMFLTDLSKDGKQKVTYRATAVGTRLFLETGSNVTVYGYNAHENAYTMESFLPSTTLESALRKYGSAR